MKRAYPASGEILVRAKSLIKVVGVEVAQLLCSLYSSTILSISFSPLVTLRPFFRNIGDVFCNINGYGIEGNTASAGTGIWRSLSGVETGLERLETYLNVSCALDLLLP